MNIEYYRKHDRERIRLWRKNNPEKYKLQQENYKIKHKENCKKWRDNNKQHQKEYRVKSCDKMKIYQKQYYQQNKQGLRIKQKEYNKTHPEIKLKSNLKYLEKCGQLFNKNSYEYLFTFNQWSKTIKKRDGNKCQTCSSKENLNAHHILHRKHYPKLSFNINNGITLCNTCHLKVHQ